MRAKTPVSSFLCRSLTVHVTYSLIATTGILAANIYFFPLTVDPIRTYQFNFPRRAARGHFPHFTVLKRLDLTGHYPARSPERVSRAVPEFLRFEVIPETMHSLRYPLVLFFLVIYTRTYLTWLLQLALSSNSSAAMGISFRYFLLVHVDAEVGDQVVRSDTPVFIRVHPPCSSMCSTSLCEVHGWIFDEISKFHGGIDVRRRLVRKYRSKAALWKWTRRPIRWSPMALLAVRSRSVSGWSAFGPIHPARSSVEPSGWSLWRWRRPFSIDISSYTSARTTCRIWWMASALRCPIASYYWSLRYSGSIDGEFRLSRTRNKRRGRNLCMLSKSCLDWSDIFLKIRWNEELIIYTYVNNQIKVDLCSCIIFNRRTCVVHAWFEVREVYEETIVTFFWWS